MQARRHDAGSGPLAVTGAGGMLGRAVVETCRRDGTVLAWTRADADLTDPEATRALFESGRPRCVVHCAAWTDVDGCETDPERAFAANVLATRNVVLAAAATGAAMCYISSDYVFDGTSSDPYYEDDDLAPANVYGRTKALGEAHVWRHLTRAWVVRTSWVFGPGGRNFVDTMCRLLRERPEVRVVEDQRGCPTYTHDLAAVLRVLTSSSLYGIYHVTNAGACTWFELATAIAARLGSRARLVPCTTRDFPRPAPRPRNSVLGSRYTAPSGLPRLRSWHEAVAAHLDAVEHGADGVAERRSDGGEASP